MFETPRQTRTAVAAPNDVSFGLAALTAIDWRRIGSTLWRGRTTILTTTALGLAAALLFILIAPRQFTAVTQILIDPSDLRGVGPETNPANQSSEAAVLQVESQVRVLTSDSVMRRVVAAEGLDHDPEFARGASPQHLLADELLTSLGLSSAPVVADNTLAAVNELKRHVQVKRAERTYVVDVSVTSRDAEKSARLANAVADAYLAEQTAVRAAAARQVSQSLTARLKELKDRVRQAEERVEAYKSSKNIVGANGVLVNEQQLSDLNNQLSAARARSAEAKARLDQIEAVQHAKNAVGAFPEALQSQTIVALRSQYAEVVRREAEQTTSLGDRHPAVIEIQAQAERLRTMIEDEVNRIATAAHGEYDAAKADEEMLANTVDALKHMAESTNESLVGLRELERDVQANRAVYEAFLVRARESGEQEQIDTKNIRVITRAEMPLRRSSPPPSTLVAMAGLLIGIASGVGLVLARAPLGSAAPPVQPQPAAGPVPLLAVLPDVDLTFGLNTVEDPKSKCAAEMRRIHAAVRQGRSNRTGASVLVVAVEGDADGTAAVALLLAAAAAATQRVLLIDADLQRRTLSALDADRTEAGLVDVAVGRRQFGDIVVRDRETGINLISFVAPSSRRSGRIDEAELRRAFEQTNPFDLVIVAAADPARDPAARFFAGLVDHIVLVARADQRHDTALDRLAARFGDEAWKVSGAVLTGVGTS